MRASPEEPLSTGEDSHSRPSGIEYIPPVVYIPGAKAIAFKHNGTKAGRKWVNHWQTLHCKSAPFDGESKARISRAIHSIYELAGYAPPADLFYEPGDECFIERALLEITLRSQFQESLDAITCFNEIQENETRVLRDLFYGPMDELEQSLARAMHRTKIPSSRELFGENGADLSALGIRTDPFVWAIFLFKNAAMKRILEKLVRVLSSADAQGVNSAQESFTYLHKAPLPCLHIIKQWTDKQELITFGNQCTGLFRQFAFLKRKWENHADFTRFNPWFHLIENVQHVYLGKTFAVLCPLPTRFSADRHGLQREWKITGSGQRAIICKCPWYPVLEHSANDGQ